MLYYTTLPKPSPGDVYVRYRDTGEHEEALVLSVVVKSGNDWTATLGCANGWDFVGGSPERRGFESWFPKGWIFDNDVQSLRPPNTQWDDKINEFVAIALGEPAPVAMPRPGDPMGQMGAVNRPVPGLEDIPAPQPGEHNAAWRARVKRANPSANMNDPRAQAMLNERWRVKRGSGAGEVDSSAG